MARMVPTRQEEKNEELKMTIREANESLKEIKRAIKEGEKLLESVDVMVKAKFDTLIEAQVIEKLASYDESMKEAVENGTNAVYRRFDLIADILLGETNRRKRDGESIMILARSALIKERAVKLALGDPGKSGSYYLDIAEAELVEKGVIPKRAMTTRDALAEAADGSDES
jgi:hypothetical protein